MLELEPDAESAELPAPALGEEPVFYLRATFGEVELLSEPFTVTTEPAPADDDSVILSEAKDLSGDSSSPAAPQNDSAGDEPEEPVGDGFPDVPQDAPADPDALPVEPIADDPDSVFQFTTQPQNGSYAGSTLQYHCTWVTSFTPKKVVIRYKNLGNWETYAEIKTGLSANGSYDFPAVSGSREYYILAYYGTGASDYRASDTFTVTTENLQFTTEPTDGSYAGSTLKYHCTWVTNFTPKKVVIRYKNLGNWETYAEIKTGLSANGSYDFPAVSGSREYYILAYYGTGASDYRASNTFTVTTENLQFTTEPTDGSYDPATLSYTAAWQTSFTPLRVVIRYKNLGTWETYAEITTGLSTTGSYEFPAVSGWREYYIWAYYGTGASDYRASNTFTVSDHEVVTSGDCGFMDATSVHWSYANHTLTLSGTGFTGDFASATVVPWNHLRSQIQTVVVEEGVQDVGAYAFKSCLSLETVNLPSTLRKIGDNAFTNCPELTDVWINMGETDFDSVTWTPSANTSLDTAAKHFAYRAKGTCGANLSWKLVDTTLIIEGSGTMYNYSGSARPIWFSYRDEITAIQISGATSIGNYAFAYFTKLESVTIPSTVTLLGNHAFTGCTALRTVSIQNAGVNIPDYCFYNCTALKSIAIPKNATRIGTAAFYGCSALATVTFPNNCALTTVGNSAFQNCKAVKTISLPKTVATIGNSAFQGCSALTTVIIPSGTQLTTIGDSAFELCRVLASISLPEGLTTIGYKAFYGCASLPKINLPSTLTSLGSYSFYGCTKAAGTIAIPSGITTIPAGCFQYCSGFHTLALVPGVTAIQGNAFAGCTKLTTVSFDGFKSQYQQITIDNTNTPLRSATVRYLYISGTMPNTNISYTIDGATGRLYINGWDEMPDGQTPWYQYGPYITEVEITGGIPVIGTENFRGCSNLTVVRLPGALETVNDRAFQDCTKITDVYYDGLASDWENIDFYTGNDPLLNATLHTGTVGGLVSGTDIYWSLDDEGTLTLYFDMDCGETDMPDFHDEREQPWYDYADQIYRLRISEGVTSLGYDNFAYLRYLEEVEIPGTVTELRGTVFANCGNLETIVLPDSVESLSGGAFWNCGNLCNVTLPAGLTEIPGSLFYGCGVLSNVYMPSTVTSIGNNAFNGCDDFAVAGNLYFDGTSAQWAAITKGSGNDALTTCRIHFTPPELAIDATNFPDANFRAHVSSHIDTDHSGYLTDEERLAVTEISCGAEDIVSLQGIEYFPNLNFLNCTDNLIEYLCPDQNPQLVYLDCSYNSLQDLDVTDLPLLETLICAGNTDLSSLDLASNGSLLYLDCNDCTLGSLNLVSNPNLEELYCQANYVTALDLSQNPNLAYLECYDNLLTELDLSRNPYLVNVDCSENSLATLTLGTQNNLIALYCHANSLTTLDLVGAPHILACAADPAATVADKGTFYEFSVNSYTLTVDKTVNNITDHDGIRIDAAHFPDDAFRAHVASSYDNNHNGWLSPDELEEYTTIVCQNLGIVSLQGIQYFTALETLYCNDNQLTELDLSQNTALCELYAYGNQLTALDLSANTELSYVDCSYNQMTEGGLRLNPSVTYLDCSVNGLHSLDLSGLPNLSTLICDETGLTELNISANSRLQYLYCERNALTSLDVSGNPALTNLACAENPQLTELILGEQENLGSLDCSGTNLTSLDISRCHILLNAYQNGSFKEENGAWIWYTPNTSYRLKVDPTTAIVTDLKTTVAATSALNTLDGPTVSFVTGGGVYEPGQTVTLTATSVASFSFQGWYLNGALYADSLTCTYEVSDESPWELRFVALYAPVPGGTVQLQVTAPRFTVSGSNATQRGYYRGQLPTGSVVTVTFQGGENMTLLYWINADGKIVSTAASYTFTAIAPTQLTAIYSENGSAADEALVVFLNSRTNGQVLAARYYTTEDTIEFPHAPTSIGKIFAGWSMSEQEIKAAMATQDRIAVYPVFEAGSQTYTVTVKNSVGAPDAVSAALPLGNEYAAVADETLGSFSYWMLDGKIIGYTPSIIVRGMGDMTLTAVYNETVEPVPVITMTDAFGQMNGEKYAMSFVATRSVPEGWTVGAQGILYTTRTDLDGLDLREVIVLNGTGIRDYTSNVTSQNGVCVFTANAKNAATVHARGYMTLTKNGVTVTVYSDEILVQSYTP